MLYGLAGNDSLNGGNGDDRLYGGAGNDNLVGGSSGDVFFFATGGGADTITDFEDGADFINLTAFTGAQDITSANFASLVGIVQNSATQFTVTVHDVTIIINDSGWRGSSSVFGITSADFVL